MKADTACPAGVDLSAIVPAGSNMLIRRLEPAERTQGGIYIPESVAGDEEEEGWKVSDPPSVGVVLRHGIECKGRWGDLDAAVVFLPTSGITFARDGVRYIILEEDTVIGMVPYEDTGDLY